MSPGSLPIHGALTPSMISAPTIISAAPKAISIFPNKVMAISACVKLKK
jgi:hypothetical protein